MTGVHIGGSTWLLRTVVMTVALAVTACAGDPTGDDISRRHPLEIERHSVRLPRCGDWSTSRHFNPRNLVHPNYGCASQRYRGRMAARPSDLVKARRLEPRDTTRSNAVIDNYRKGEPTAVKPNPDEGAIRTLTTRSGR